MYTVLQIFYKDCSREDVAMITNEIVAVKEDKNFVYENHDDRITFEISSSDDWRHHIKDLGLFIRQFRLPLHKAQKMGMHVFADLAFEPEDLQNRNYLTVIFNNETIREASDACVELAVTFYSNKETLGTDEGDGDG